MGMSVHKCGDGASNFNLAVEAESAPRSNGGVLSSSSDIAALIAAASSLLPLLPATTIGLLPFVSSHGGCAVVLPTVAVDDEN